MIQELGETRQEMTRGLLNKIFKIIDDNPHLPDRYWITVYAKPESGGSRKIHQKIIVTNRKPPMLLATLVFCVDKRRGELLLEWALPGDWPTYAVGDQATPVPEVIASIEKLGANPYVYE